MDDGQTILNDLLRLTQNSPAQREAIRPLLDFLNWNRETIPMDVDKGKEEEELPIEVSPKKQTVSLPKKQTVTKSSFRLQLEEFYPFKITSSILRETNSGNDYISFIDNLENEKKLWSENLQAFNNAFKTKMIEALTKLFNATRVVKKSFKEVFGDKRGNEIAILDVDKIKELLQQKLEQYQQMPGEIVRVPEKILKQKEKTPPRAEKQKEKTPPPPPPQRVILDLTETSEETLKNEIADLTETINQREYTTKQKLFTTLPSNATEMSLEDCMKELERRKQYCANMIQASTKDRERIQEFQTKLLQFQKPRGWIIERVLDDCMNKSLQVNIVHMDTNIMSTTFQKLQQYRNEGGLIKYYLISAKNRPLAKIESTEKEYPFVKILIEKDNVDTIKKYVALGGAKFINIFVLTDNNIQKTISDYFKTFDVNLGEWRLWYTSTKIHATSEQIDHNLYVTKTGSTAVECRICAKIPQQLYQCCQGVVYCGGECQAEDWENHQEICLRK